MEGVKGGGLPNRLYNFRHFVLGAQASSAEVKSFLLTIYNDSSRVNIRHPATISAALGVTHIMTELGCFFT